MMTFGTVGAFGFDDFHPPEVIGLYARAGCSVVQIYRNRLKNISSKDMIAVCRDVGIRIDSLHAHFGDDLDPSSEDEKTRRQAVELYVREGEFCRELGGTLAVVHPSPAHVPEGNLERRYAQLQKSFAELSKAGEKLGVVFAFENMPAYHPVGADVKRLVDEVTKAASPQIVFLLDFGHAHMTCGIAQALQWSGRQMKYTHVHDNDGVNDTHALPYRGNLPWDACRQELAASGYAGVFLLEVFEKADDLRRLLNDEWKQNIGRILAGRG
ncbi:MAG TPA: sugar phosphate isomerase/epimerase family protein [Phycisphaerae bacterium]|nr:sugar phosphate isomerase/epimerase family protein [Phycisphaerae bacterium]